MKSNITILICLIVLTISCANKTEPTWQEIANKNWNDDTYFIKENEVKDRNSLIVYLTTGYYYDKQDTPEVQRVLKLLENKVVNNDLDSILTILYYNHHLNNDQIKDNSKLLGLLLQFRNQDKSNALPSYLLSYYYALNKDSENTIKYLKEGNELSKIDLYNKELNKITFDFYNNKTKSEIFAYNSTGTTTNSFAKFVN